MDSFILGDDIRVVCVTADSFPEGIEDAHLELNAKLTPNEKRRFFGISRPDETGRIIYKAAADEMFIGEAESLGLETFLIRRGAYMSFYIKNHRDEPGSIARAFELLLGQHEADPNGYCLEWYIGENDVKCLVPSGPEEYPQ